MRRPAARAVPHGLIPVPKSTVVESAAAPLHLTALHYDLAAALA